MYMYVHMFVYEYMYICLYPCWQEVSPKPENFFDRKLMYMYIYTCVHIFIYIYICKYTFVFIYICVYIWSYIFICTTVGRTHPPQKIGFCRRPAEGGKQNRKIKFLKRQSIVSVYSQFSRVPTFKNFYLMREDLLA